MFLELKEWIKFYSYCVEIGLKTQSDIERFARQHNIQCSCELINAVIQVYLER